MTVAKIDHYWMMLRYFGPSWLMHRALYSMRLRNGMIRRQLPCTKWSDQPLSGFLLNQEIASSEKYFEYRQAFAPKFFFDPKDYVVYQQLLAQWQSDEQSSISLSDDFARGRFRFFSHEYMYVGMPPRWHIDPFSGYEFPHDRHWTDIGDFSAGDIKLPWEMSRFGFVYALVRAAWRSGNDRYAELFWRTVEDWRKCNPPNTGVNWKCGQEISLRVMAWCFGLYGFADSPATTPERVANLAQMIAVSGHRIESNVAYALSQKNNHGISEATGLWTIGSLFPEFADSPRWSRLGRELLEKQARELIYDDGSFSQHSINYHRFMLHDYIWSIRLGDVLGHPFSNKLMQLLAKAGEFVYQIQDESTGCVPCYGQDDGALILPLDECNYRDYRPVVQATIYLTTGHRRFEQGEWDEPLLWLFGPNALRASTDTPQRRDFAATSGGYFTLRSTEGFAFTRAGNFRHRPAQADMLHVDIWWRGQNIAVDPGTYSYNAPEPWNNSLAGTAYHNTITVDGLDQMERVGRFVWLPWITGKSFGSLFSQSGHIACWQGTHDGYRRLRDRVSYRRSIVKLGDDHWLILDALTARKAHQFRLHWLLLDVPYESDFQHHMINLETKSGSYRIVMTSSSESAKWNVERASPDRPTGWRSSYYHDREPALAVSLEMNTKLIVFASLFGPNSQTVAVTSESVHATGLDWAATIHLHPFSTPHNPLVKHINTTGSLTDCLEVT